jgi:hypothetical protein
MRKPHWIMTSLFGMMIEENQYSSKITECVAPALRGGVAAYLGLP